MATLKEPLAGWLDSSQALTQAIARIGIGVIRVICAEQNVIMETVPMDLACNCLIASAWEAASNKIRYVK